MISCECSQQHPGYGKFYDINNIISSTNELQRKNSIWESINENKCANQLQYMEFMWILNLTFLKTNSWGNYGKLNSDFIHWVLLILLLILGVMILWYV